MVQNTVAVKIGDRVEFVEDFYGIAVKTQAVITRMPLSCGLVMVRPYTLMPDGSKFCYKSQIIQVSAIVSLN